MFKIPFKINLNQILTSSINIISVGIMGINIFLVAWVIIGASKAVKPSPDPTTVQQQTISNAISILKTQTIPIDNQN